LSVGDDAVLRTHLYKQPERDLIIASVECKRMFQIGDRRMQTADLGNWLR
jgi:hypothetical protein